MPWNLLVRPLPLSVVFIYMPRSITLASRIYLYSIIHAGVFGSLYSIYSNLFFLTSCALFMLHGHLDDFRLRFAL